MQESAQIQATVWSGQRASVPRAGFNTSLRAFEVALNPSQFVGQGTLTLKLPWQTGADPLATMMVAFGTGGRSIVLRLAPGSTPESPTAIIGAGEFQYLAGTSSVPTGTVSILVAVAEAKPTGRAVSTPPKLTTLWTRSSSRTHYASRTRVAIVIHGILNSSADLQTLSTLLNGSLPTEGDSGVSLGFDIVAGIDYDWRQPIETNGAAVAAKINSTWGDASKYEVHIFAHSMGGLVSRYALEKVGVPSVTQLVTFGTPHLGVPLTILANLCWFKGSTSWLTLGFSLTWPGVRELVDDSDVIASLKGSRASGLQYQALAGDSHANFYSGLGDIAEVIYTQLNDHHIDHDGIVPEYSALGGPATITQVQPLTHSTLVGQVNAYWATSPSASWVVGMNRKIATIEVSPASVNFTMRATHNLTLRFFDKDHDEIDLRLIPALELSWSSSDPTIASVSPFTVSTQGVVTGVKVGGPVTVTVTDKSSGVSGRATVQVNTSEWTNPIDGSVLLWVPGGTFQMGCIHPNFPQEAPVHPVTLSGYWMGKNEVTVGQYRQFCTATNRAMPPEPFFGWIDDSHPVVNVTWDDCVAYADWAGLKLPTEAQWEFAATGGDGRTYPWGDTWDPSKCINNVDGLRTSSASVGSCPSGASPLGMLDMVGNVSCWSSDWYGPYSSGAQTNPTGPATGEERTLRGSPWLDDLPYWYRGTLRGELSPGARSPYVGFRLSLPG